MSTETVLKLANLYVVTLNLYINISSVSVFLTRLRTKYEVLRQSCSSCKSDLHYEKITSMLLH